MKIYVGNLPYSATEEQLREKFGEHGEVEEVALPTDRETGRPRGFGFVTMNDDEAAKAAIAAVNGFEMDGRQLRVDEAKPRREGGGGGRRDRW
ncbi:MAG: RNA-binding protein [bacterium]|nr:RNA-binding protein [bacterium]